MNWNTKKATKRSNIIRNWLLHFEHLLFLMLIVIHLSALHQFAVPGRFRSHRRTLVVHRTVAWIVVFAGLFCRLSHSWKKTTKHHCAVDQCPKRAIFGSASRKQLWPKLHTKALRQTQSTGWLPGQILPSGHCMSQLQHAATDCWLGSWLGDARDTAKYRCY